MPKLVENFFVAVVQGKETCAYKFLHRRCWHTWIHIIQQWLIIVIIFIIITQKAKHNRLNTRCWWCGVLLYMVVDENIVSYMLQKHMMRPAKWLCDILAAFINSLLFINEREQSGWILGHNNTSRITKRRVICLLPAWLRYLPFLSLNMVRKICSCKCSYIDFVRGNSFPGLRWMSWAECHIQAFRCLSALLDWKVARMHSSTRFDDLQSEKHIFGACPQEYQEGIHETTEAGQSAIFSWVLESYYYIVTRCARIKYKWLVFYIPFLIVVGCRVIHGTGNDWSIYKRKGWWGKRNKQS